MWNIRLHSCCRTPGGASAGKFSSSVGRANGGKGKKRKMSHQVILASVQQVAAMLECEILDFTLYQSGFSHSNHRFHYTFDTASTSAAAFELYATRLQIMVLLLYLLYCNADKMN